MAKKRLFKSSRNSLTLFSLDPGMRGGYLSSRTLMEISFPYRPQECDICSVHLATALECCTHLRKAHGLTKPLLLCSVCGRMERRRHNIECHAAKCTRTLGARTPVANRVKCSLCDRTFKTQRGLSLHRRSAHTADYMAQLLLPADGQAAPKRRKWSDEEVVVLSEHLDKWKVRKGFLDMACTLLPGRTRGQIRYKVAQVKKAALLPALPGPSQPYRSLMDELMTEEVQQVVPRSIVVRGILRALAGDEGEGRFGSSLVQSEQDTQEALTDLARACRSLRGRIMRAGRGRTSVRRSRTTGVQRFRQTQREMVDETRKLARLILDGSTVGICPLSTRVVEDHFRSKWEGEDGFKGIGQFRAGQFCSNFMLAIPISPAEVLKARKESKRGSAAGPDGVDKVSLVKWDPSGIKLARMYTRFLVTQKIPESLKKNRTALIPKSSDATALRVVSNWRPITIGSMVLRLFSSILYKRLSNACATCVRQKGFSTTPGCSENLLVVEGALKSSSKTGSLLAMVFIDLAKAFDSVSHKHIRAALVQRKVDPAFIRLVENAYKNCSTRVRTGDGYTKDIAIRVGVKQGDPLSPLLFNLAIDPLLCTLEEQGVGFGLDGDKVTVLAYADDLVMFSDSWDGMSKNMSILEAFCDLTGLRVNTAKCHGFFAAGGRRTAGRYNNCPPWRLGGGEIHMIGPGETVDYLGLAFNPLKGPRQPDVATLIEVMGQKISQARLRPSQRLEIFCTYAIPRVFYKAINCTFRSTCMRQVDLTIRRYVKAWLHLSPGTADGLLYSRCKDGGLGIPCLGRIIPRCKLRRIFSLYHSADPVVSGMARAMVSPGQFCRLWLAGGGTEDLKPKALMDLTDAECESFTLPRSWRDVEFVKWTRKRPQGFGVGLFKGDKASNSWLPRKGRPQWKESHLIRALQMRTNVLPTLEFRHRGVSPGGIPPCRACGMLPETASHILGGCVETRLNRMARHNRLCSLLAMEGEKKGWKVMRERRIIRTDGTWGVPDLIFVKGSTLLVVDVTVRYDGSAAWLEAGRKEKADKYSPFLGLLGLEFPSATDLSAHGFVMGVRGKWLGSNFKVLDKLGFRKKGKLRFAKMCSRTTILKSVDVFQAFNKAVRGAPLVVYPLDVSDT